MANSKPITRFRFWLWLIAFIGVIVPSRLRATWRREWEAELRHREAMLAEWDRLDWRARLDLARRSASAFLDAVWLQPKRLEDEMFQDLRYGVRMLLKHRGFTAVAALSLALGIGANTAIFSVVDALLLRTLPVRNPERLVALTNSESGFYTSYPRFERYRNLTQVFSGVSAICLVDRYNVRVNNTAGGPDLSDTGQVGIGLVSGNYFSTLGAGTVIGRPLTADDDRAPGGHPVAVISYSYWERRLGRVADVIGRTLTLNETTFSIVGVTPRGFFGEWIGQPSDVWIPIAMQAQVMPERPLLADPRANWVRVIARLKPDVAPEQAEAGAQVSYQQLLRESSGPNPTPQENQRIAGLRLSLQSAARGYAPQRQSFLRPLMIVLIVVGLTLLIACANVANLLLARAAARRQEMAVRAALGAIRSRIVRQLLTESLLLVVMGGALGALFAAWGTSALGRFLGSGLPRMGFAAPVTMDLDLRLDVRILAFTAAMCVATGLLFGLAPALRASKVALASALGRRGADSSSSSTRFSLGKGLVILQVALSLLLLVGAGLFVRTLRNLKAQDIGLDRQHVLLVWAAPAQTGRSGEAVAALYQMAQRRVSALPGVISASPSNAGVLTGGGNGAPSETLTVEGQPPKPGLSGGIAGAAVGSGFFSALGMTLLAGRDFTEQDTEKSPRVAIINETLARFEFGGKNPIGKRFFRRGETGSPWEIVGVVKDTKDRNLRQKDLGVTYTPYRQQMNKLAIMCLVARTSVAPASVAPRVRQALREIDPGLPVLNLTTVEEQLDGILIQERLLALLASFFGVVAALLACLGLYGVISYAVARRANEIGIRLALGATPAAVLGIILKESLMLAFAGIAIGTLATLAFIRLISTMLFGVSAADPLTLCAAITLIIVVTAMSALLPARRATKVDPMVALRHE
jgi:predicted permease